MVAEGIFDFATSFKGWKLTIPIMEGAGAVHDGKFEGGGNLLVASLPKPLPLGGPRSKTATNLLTVDVFKTRHIGSGL